MAYKSKALKTSAMNRKKAYAYGKSLLALRRQGRLKVSAGGYQPIFTETYSGPGLNVTNAGLGGRFVVNINQIPQIGQYQSLYRKYRILKAVVYIVPQYNSFDANAQAYNIASTVPSFAEPRMVYSIDDTPTTAPPASELLVLQNNGVKICQLSKIKRISWRPVAEIKDANGNEPVFKNKFLAFNPTLASNADHFGVNWWMSAYVPVAGTYQTFTTYFKVTFQLSDPQ